MNNQLVIDNVSNTTGSSTSPHIVLDNNEIPYIIWTDTTSGNNEIYISKWTSGTGWTKMDGTAGYDNISNTSGSSTSAKLIFNSNNVPYVIWIDNTVTNYDVYFSKYTSGTGWTKMDGTAGYDNIYDSTVQASSPSIAIDSNDTPYVVWNEQVLSGFPDILFSKYTSGTGWTKMNGTAGVDNLSNSYSTYNSLSATIKMSSDNEPYVLFDEYFSTDENIFFTKYTYGVGWTQMDGQTLGKENVSDTSGAKTTQVFELDSNNIPYVAWTDNTPGNSEILFKKYTPGTGWTKMDGTSGYDNVSNTSGGSSLPKIKINNFNVPYILWLDTTTGNADVYFSKYTAATGWTQMDGTSGYDNVSATATAASGASFVIGPNDEPHIVWQQAVGIYSEIYYRKWTTGTGWTKADYTNGTDNVSSSASGYSQGPQIDVDSTNQAYITWYEGTANYEVYFSHWFYDATDQVDISAAVDATLTFLLSSTSCNLGTFSASSVSTCSYSSTVSTNATNGYIAYIEDTGSTGLVSGSNEINGTVSGGANSTAVDAGTEEYGLATSDSDYASTDINQQETTCTTGTSPVNGVDANNIKGNSQSYAISSAPVSSDEVTICHAVSITGTTEAGAYSQTVEITVVANY